MEKLGINLVNHLENNALIIWSLKNNQKICETIKYKDLLKQVLKLSLFIEGEEIPNKSTIGIYSDKSYSSIALSLAIIEQSCAFCHITKENIENSCLDEFDVKYFFSDSQLHLNLNSNNIELIKKLKVCEENYYFYKTKSTKQFKTFKDAGNKMNQICYCVATSGTTGKRKIVRVSYNSIFPNIESLQKIFQLNSTDVLLSSAPITFDVYLMDLFLAFYSGAALMIIPNELRFDSFVFDSNESNSVTFIQMTPTIFHQYGNEIIQNKIMHANSRLKYLVLGGEKFPSTREVLQWQNWDIPNHKRIFNIYGITEMSCWSLIHEVTVDDLKFGRIPLGEPLSNTSVAYYKHNGKDFKENVEELILTSATRINFVDDKDWDDKLESNALFAYITNDLIEKIDGKLYWYARLDDMVKRFGERVDLTKIETVAAEIISPVSCILTKKRIALFYQSTSNETEELLINHLRLKLKSSEFPDDIKRIDFLPICKHGKLSKKNLKELYHDILKEEENGKQTAEEIFLEAINQMFNLKLAPPSQESDEPDGKRIKSDIDSTFNQIGGSSFDALRVTMKIEDKIEISSNGSLLPKLLDNRHSIKEIFSYLKELNLKPKINSIKLNKQGAATSLFNFKSVKKFDLQKCIDSSPALICIDQKNYVAIGSHSGKIIVFEAESHKLITEVLLNDRVECEIAQYKNYLVVGCYDGNLYFLDFLNDDQNKIIKWKFDSGGMIKSKALIINNYILFGNYNYEQNLRCIMVEDDKLTLKWSKLLGLLGGILANPLQIDDNSLLMCTLDGTCERLNIVNGKTIWSKKFEFPIFSTPVIVKNHEKILIAEVMRRVTCIDFDGNIYWKFETDGHIFSSFFLKQMESEMKIIFGSHDKKLRCLRYDIKDESKIFLEWETEIQSQIYTTPKKLIINNKELVVTCSTNGYVNLIDLNTGIYENSVKLPGEVFSTPLIYKNFIYVGCRDNNFYCLKVE